jgi:hypothetical protein
MRSDRVGLGLFVLLLVACSSDGADEDSRPTPRPASGIAPPPQTSSSASGALTLEGAGFGTQIIGAPAQRRSFTIRNGSNADLTLAPPQITGEGAGDYKAATLANAVLHPNASVTVDVDFQPFAKGPRTAVLSVGSATVTLQGAGECPKAPTDLGARGVTESCTTPLYVIVGERSGRIVSTDAIMWTHDQRDRTNCLTNADGTLDCGGTCDSIAESTCTERADKSLDCARPNPADATQEICTGLDDTAFRAAFGLGLVVTAGDFGIFTSADAGVSWKKAGPPAAQQWKEGVHVAGVAFGNGTFLVASNGTNFTSTDGTTWVRSVDTVGGGYYGFGDLIFGGGHFVATGEDHVGPMTKVSEDGINWHDPHPVAYTKLAWGNGTFVAVATNKKAVSKDNGVTWNETTDTCSDWRSWTGAPGDCVGDLRTVTFDGTKFHACSFDHCLTSTDGETWAYVPDAVTGNVSTIYVGDHFFLLAGATYYETSDLTKWGMEHAVPASFSPASVTYGRVLTP